MKKLIQIIKIPIKILIIYSILGGLMTPIPFYMKLSHSDFERMRFVNNPAFIYDATRFSLNILKASTNSIAFLIAPVALIFLPGSIIADTISLPYDIYLYKRADNIQFWRQIIRNRSINDDTSDIDSFDKFYDIYGSYLVGKRVHDEIVRDFPNYAILHFLLASRHPEFTESKLIIDHITGSSYAKPKFANELCKITIKDVDRHVYAINGIFENTLTPEDCIDMYYEILTGINDIERKHQIRLLLSLKHRLEKSTNKKRYNYIDNKLKGLIQEEKANK